MTTTHKQTLIEQVQTGTVYEIRQEGLEGHPATGMLRTHMHNLAGTAPWWFTGIGNTIGELFLDPDRIVSLTEVE